MAQIIMTTLQCLFPKRFGDYELHGIPIGVIHFLDLIFMIQDSICHEQLISLSDELFHLLTISFLTFSTL